MGLSRKKRKIKLKERQKAIKKNQQSFLEALVKDYTKPDPPPTLAVNYNTLMANGQIIWSKLSRRDLRKTIKRQQSNQRLKERFGITKN